MANSVHVVVEFRFRLKNWTKIMYNGFDPNSQNNDFYNKRVQLDGFNTITIKGQLISNGLLGIFNSSKSEKNQKKSS